MIHGQNPEGPGNSGMREEDLEPPSEFGREFGDTKIFTYPLAEHPLLRKYRPKFIGAGGTSLVYEVEGHPDIVVKASYNATMEKIERERNQAHAHVADVLDPAASQAIDDQIVEDRRRNAVLKEYFGKEHMVPSRTLIAKIPVTKEILEWLYYQGEEQSAPADAHEAWSVVTVQKKLPEILQKQHLSFESGYAELDEDGQFLPRIDEKAYGKITKAMLHPHDTAITKKEVARFVANHHQAVHTLFQQAESSNPELKEIMSDIITKAIQYTQETGEILDIMATDNLVIYQENGGLNYKLPDVLFYWLGMIRQTQEVIGRVIESSPLGSNDAAKLLNTINYVRFTNCMAHLLDIENRIQLIPEDVDDSAIDYLKILKQNLKN